MAKDINAAFIAYVPHHIHKEWAEAVCEKSYNYTFNKVTNGKNQNLLGNSALINQIVSFVKGLFIPYNDIFLCEGIATMLPVITKKKLNKDIRCIIINSDNFFYSLISEQRKLNRIHKEYINNIDGIISTSRYMRDQAGAFVNVPHKIVYPWVDNKFFDVTSNLKKKEIGFFTALRKNKGADIMIDSFKIIHKNDPRYKLRIVGKTEEAIGFNLQGVNLVGFMPPSRMPDQFSQIGSYVNPARHEPFGVNILEAMACGIPPIVSNTCGASEIVAKVSKDLIVNADAKEVAERMLWLDSDISFKEKLGKKCRRIALEHTKERSIKSFKDEFNSLVNEM